MKLPLCVCGVGGGSLKRRIEEIMTRRRGFALTPARRVVLAITTVATVGVPVLVGAMTMRAQPGQDAAGPPPQFEVASVKRNTSGHGPYSLGIQMQPGGVVRTTNAPLPAIIAAAYGVSVRELDLERVGSDAAQKPVLQGVYDVDARGGANARARRLPRIAPASCG